MAGTAVSQMYRIHSEMVSIFASALSSYHGFLLSFPVGKVNLFFWSLGFLRVDAQGLGIHCTDVPHGSE